MNRMNQTNDLHATDLGGGTERLFRVDTTRHPFCEWRRASEPSKPRRRTPGKA